MGSFRILHASDLHIGAKAGRTGFPEWLRHPTSIPTDVTTHDPAIAEGLARFLIDDGDFDLVLLTGDVATTARSADLQAAVAFVQGPPPGARHSLATPLTLAASGLPLAMLPGNHDRFGGRFLVPSKQEFDVAFSSYWPPGSLANLLALLTDDTDGEQLAIIGGDFSLPTAWDATNPLLGYLGQGRVYADALGALDHATTQVRQTHESAAVIWAVHFPVEFNNLGVSLDLIDQLWLAAAAAQHGVRYVLAGHTHEARDYTLGNGVDILCAGTATAWRSSHTQCLHARELTVANGTVVDHRQRQWDWIDGRFA